MTRGDERSIDTYEDAQAYTRRYAKTFYFASHVLPRQKRLASYAVYGFCRLVDNVADSGAYPDINVAAARLQELRQEIISVCSGDERRGARWSALREVVSRSSIPADYFLDLIRGVEMDLTKSRYETFDELQEYCYCVASVVGMTMARVFGAATPEAMQHAADLGTGMQLTNILRDVGEDLGMGRMYVPVDELRQFGIDEDHLHARRVDDRFRAFMQFQIERARSYYRRAEAGIGMLPDDGSRYCVRMMSTLYERILDEITAIDYDVFNRRAYVALPVKLRHAVRLVLHHRTRSLEVAG